MRKALRSLSLALAALLALASLACAESTECPIVETRLKRINRFGNIFLDISGNAILAMGYEYGDVVTVEIGNISMNFPLCSDYNGVDVGAPVCSVTTAEDPAEADVTLAINTGNLAAWLGIATPTDIDEAPGYRWDYADPYSEGMPVRLSLSEKGAYLEQIRLHQLQLSNNRADYPNLTDAQYANFRNVATTGMGANVLYRSSSPINPKHNRSREADNAVNAAGIRTVLNLSDNQAVMESYEDYAQSYYSRLDVLPLDMIVLFEPEVLRDGVCRGLRFLSGHEGPYLVHCSIGKDRTGFICALLECLMGATADEVVADYMVTYYNFFGIEPGSDAYEIIANSNIRKILSDIFHVEDLSDADLSACAEACLLDLGLTADEIAAVRRCLGTDIL